MAQETDSVDNQGEHLLMDETAVLTKEATFLLKSKG